MTKTLRKDLENLFKNATSIEFSNTNASLKIDTDEQFSFMVEKLNTGNYEKLHHVNCEIESITPSYTKDDEIVKTITVVITLCDWEYRV